MYDEKLWIALNELEGKSMMGLSQEKNNYLIIQRIINFSQFQTEVLLS